MHTYLISYQHDGATWVLEIKARDAADAKARICAANRGTVDGELIAEVPAVLGIFARSGVAIRNWLCRGR